MGESTLTKIRYSTEKVVLKKSFSLLASPGFSLGKQQRMGHPQQREVTDAWLLIQEASGSLVQFLRKKLRREFPTKV